MKLMWVVHQKSITAVTLSVYSVDGPDVQRRSGCGQCHCTTRSQEGFEKAAKISNGETIEARTVIEYGWTSRTAS